MVVVTVRGKEFSIKEDILEKNKNFLVTIDLKNKEMLKEFDYVYNNSTIFEKFIIPILEDKLNKEYIEKTILEI